MNVEGTANNKCSFPFLFSFMIHPVGFGFVNVGKLILIQALQWFALFIRAYRTRLINKRSRRKRISKTEKWSILAIFSWITFTLTVIVVGSTVNCSFSEGFILKLGGIAYLCAKGMSCMMMWCKIKEVSKRIPKCWMTRACSRLFIALIFILPLKVLVWTFGFAKGELIKGFCYPNNNMFAMQLFFGVLDTLITVVSLFLFIRPFTFILKSKVIEVHRRRQSSRSRSGVKKLRSVVFWNMVGSICANLSTTTYMLLQYLLYSNLSPDNYTHVILCFLAVESFVQVFAINVMFRDHLFVLRKCRSRCRKCLPLCCLAALETKTGKVSPAVAYKVCEKDSSSIRRKTHSGGSSEFMRMSERTMLPSVTVKKRTPKTEFMLHGFDSSSTFSFAQDKSQNSLNASSPGKYSRKSSLEKSCSRHSSIQSLHGFELGCIPQALSEQEKSTGDQKDSKDSS